ncbi:uncharacterized protein GLRG_08477 [Colletotrichum graminicola M1.001]|uniref:Secreted protein n=1 Tax=Colletotrichum graminicola (strain M1.001 / M2 / FGSC 10212) TaxID=645133 RepID=E3QR45_COLGM|nr:uncharacterized protein GLRG_08477 [Colletotrichum graminicola M1.001]EFQ33333.1 hypothetical protein GLRG_08477 [Colletotrichum graminicola M1.001]
MTLYVGLLLLQESVGVATVPQNGLVALAGAPAKKKKKKEKKEEEEEEEEEEKTKTRRSTTWHGSSSKDTSDLRCEI